VRIAIRVDASEVMGTGHLKRCMALAEAAIELNAQVWLLCRRLDAIAPQVLRTAKCPVIWLTSSEASEPVAPKEIATPYHAWLGVPWQQDANETVRALQSIQPDWVVVDHYALDARWHLQVRRDLECKLFVIDDLGDRVISADVLLDQNLSPDHQTKYKGYVDGRPRWLTGPRFALLSNAFRNAARYRLHHRVRSIGIFMGGSDPGGVSSRVLQICRHEVAFDGFIEVVSTSANTKISALAETCATWPDTVLTVDEPDLAAFFSRHDLQIGAGGGATWERCCIGVPSILIPVADNQRAVIPELSERGVVRGALLADPHFNSYGFQLPSLAEVLIDLMRNFAERRVMADRSRALVDGRGAQRAALAMLSEQLLLRPVTLPDALLLFRWRNHSSVRAVSKNPEPIVYEDHKHWLNSVTVSSDRWMWVAEVGRLPVGSLRFDLLGPGRVEVSLYLDPDLQGLGLGARMLSAGEKVLKEKFTNAVMIEATVVEGNIASQKLFQACGYSGGPTRFIKKISL
jgi:UDP-2,4-diacetamido-2,4,6-trideoxy-beta-L-altropyranose hydrolase